MNKMKKIDTGEIDLDKTLRKLFFEVAALLILIFILMVVLMFTKIA